MAHEASTDGTATASHEASPYLLVATAGPTDVTWEARGGGAQSSGRVLSATCTGHPHSQQCGDAWEGPLSGEL